MNNNDFIEIHLQELYGALKILNIYIHIIKNTSIIYFIQEKTNQILIIGSLHLKINFIIKNVTVANWYLIW